MSDRQLRVGLTQWSASAEVSANLDVALALIAQAGDAHADVVLLPENGLCLGTNSEMRSNALSLDSPEIGLLADAATSSGAVVILGGMKRLVAGSPKVRNSAVVLAPGEGVVGMYDKIHLFDAKVGGQTFAASSVEEAGERPVIVDVNGTRLGLTICYDVRFPELHRRLAAEGAEVLLVPAAFTHVTGLAHWEVLLRARAIENLAFVVASATVRGGSDSFETWGHAMVVSPWGEVLTDLGDRSPAVEVVQLDLSEVDAARTRLPALNGRRPDAYGSDIDLIKTGGAQHA
jgi:predicted amidohydrolase